MDYFQQAQSLGDIHVAALWVTSELGEARSAHQHWGNDGKVSKRVSVFNK